MNDTASVQITRRPRTSHSVPDSIASRKIRTIAADSTLKDCFIGLASNLGIVRVQYLLVFSTTVTYLGDPLDWVSSSPFQVHC